jgi:hypothetical protein
MNKIKLTATIPTAQYANISPEIEVEADSYEEALQIAESRLVEIWNRYVEPGKELRGVASNRVKLRAYVGGDIWYDEALHQYSNEAGDVYLSGSVYANSFKKPFDSQTIAGAMAKKSGTNADEIIKMWSLKGEASRDFGNAIHKAMQLFETYRILSDKLGKTSNLHDNFVLKDVVESFEMAYKGIKSVSEVIVVDHKTKRAGTIDRLEILGEKHGRVCDYKTGDVEKNLDVYKRQLEFYTEIMEADGWKMEPPIIYGWNGKWKEYKL